MSKMYHYFLYELKILMNYRIKVDIKIKSEKSSNQHINIFYTLYILYIIYKYIYFKLLLAKY